MSAFSNFAATGLSFATSIGMADSFTYNGSAKTGFWQDIPSMSPLGEAGLRQDEGEAVLVVARADWPTAPALRGKVVKDGLTWFISEVSGDQISYTCNLRRRPA
jgi:hypothetical protein